MSKDTKILVVDDDRDLVESIKIILESSDYKVITANNPTDGLIKASSERPDLILLDVMMPQGTEGFHFVWEIRQRQDQYFRKVPIIVLSAIHEKTDLRFYPNASDGTYQAGEYLPVQDFVDKPVDPTLLLERIQKHLHLAERWKP